LAAVGPSPAKTISVKFALSLVAGPRATSHFPNEVIIASHFSTRLHPDQIRRIIEKRLPESLQGRLKVWL
jgi:hypothetical protein